jgi:ribosomal protein S27E
MGRMKEVYMEIIERDFNGDQDAHIQALAEQSCEEFSYMNDVPCPNCFNNTLHRNETEAVCEVCAQEFVFVGSSIRFK